MIARLEFVPEPSIALVPGVEVMVIIEEIRLATPVEEIVIQCGEHAATSTPATERSPAPISCRRRLTAPTDHDAPDGTGYASSHFLLDRFIKKR